MKMFPCTSCGVCCKNISHIPELNELDLGNGTCKYFNKQNNICLIYETRPDICNVNLMFEKKYYKYYTREEYVKLNIDACNKLQIMYNIEERFRIKI